MAIQAARAAGSKLRIAKRGAILDDAGRDIKHQADLDAEKTIIEYLNDNSSLPILTEERGLLGKIDQNSCFWVVDPLDGTLNFSRNLALSCVSIALWQQNDPIFGVVYDFNNDDMFVGIPGAGAWCNDQPIHVANKSRPEQMVLATGFPLNRDFSSSALQQFLSRIQNFKKIRLFGSAALSLAYVACGRIDAYTEENIMLWDVAAGIALVRGAGGYVVHQNSQDKRWAVDISAGNVFQSNNN